MNSLRKKGYTKVSRLEKTSIRVEELGMYLQTHGDTSLRQQFKRDPRPINVTTHTGTLEENQRKNNYPNIIPYDQTRVHLKVGANVSDYINASYIRGINKEFRFIAAQSPNHENCVGDFLKMIVEQNVSTIVMLSDHEEDECEQYWSENGSLRFETVKSKVVSKNEYSDYIVRTLEIKHLETESPRLVRQFQYTSWTSQSVPWSPWSFVEFHKKVASHPSFPHGPVLVHCSGGVGRTGIFIALCNILEQAQVSGRVDIFKTFIRLRQDRMNMIHTADQYVFLHDAAYVAIVSSTKCNNSLTSQETKDSLEDITTMSNQEFKQVYELSKYLNSKMKVTSEGPEENKLQNASGEDLSVSTADDSEVKRLRKDYFIIQDFRTKSTRYILCPFPKSALDFWQLVMQHKIAVVISFELDNHVESSFLPSSPDTSLHFQQLAVTCISVCKTTNWEEQKLSIQDSTVVTHLKCNFKEPDSRQLLSLAKSSLRLCSEHEGALFMSKNGIKFSDIACLACLMLSSLAKETFVSISHLVVSVKALNPSIIQTCEEYQTLCEVLQRHRLLQSASKDGYCNLEAEDSEADLESVYCNMEAEDTQDDLESVYTNMEAEDSQDDLKSVYEVLDS